MAGITNRESKAQKTDDEIKYAPESFNDDADNFTSVELESVDRARYLDVLIAHFERQTRQNFQEANNSASKEQFSEAVKNIMDQCLSDLEEAMAGEEAFNIHQQVSLVHLSTLALLELPDQPPLLYVEWTDKVLKWLARFGPSEIFGKIDRQAGSNHHVAEKLCACIAVVEATFRPVPESMSIYPKLSKIIDKTSEADARGCLIRLAAVTVVTETECESLGQLIENAIDSPAEVLIIHGIKAAAAFFDRFGDDMGLNSDILEKEIPSAGQRECGVSKANIERECKEVFEYVRADDGEEHLPSAKITEDIDHNVEGFNGLEVLRHVQRVYGGSLTLNFQRTRNGVFRIAQRALGYKKNDRDRALGVSKSVESLSRERAHRDQDKERSAARDHRRQLDDQQFE